MLPIVSSHLGLDWIHGGYIGVDVFFVISGYLITSLVVQTLEAGTFSFRGFWGRRVRRILPALSVVTAATFASAHFFVFKGERIRRTARAPTRATHDRASKSHPLEHRQTTPPAPNGTARPLGACPIGGLAARSLRRGTTRTACSDA
ncbi:MAG: hypothetical protein IPK67_18815 [Planctomycetes bacterium]|nr:hypothetical protein [Planctomycetota bacterium]